MEKSKEKLKTQQINEKKYKKVNKFIKKLYEMIIVS